MLPAAYMGMIVIWSTTPLAIKWSSVGVSSQFGVTARMGIGALLCLLLVRLARHPLPWHRRALRTYLAASVGIFGSMSSVYWGAQFVPSGLVSVIFGLTPVATALLATQLLGERSGPLQWGGMALGLAGLALIFRESLSDAHIALAGLAAVVLAVCLHALSMVMVKAHNDGLSGLTVTCGALLVSLPLYLLSWLLLDGAIPHSLPGRTLVAIVYLGIFGSVIGFVLYYYALGRLQAGQLALVPLLTPVVALWLGYLFNDERLSLHTVAGILCILLGLVVHQWRVITGNR